MATELKGRMFTELPSATELKNEALVAIYQDGANYSITADKIGSDSEQSDWLITDTSSSAYIKNKPIITTPLQSDWNVTDINSLAYILNKPNIDVSKYIINGENETDVLIETNDSFRFQLGSNFTLNTEGDANFNASSIYGVTENEINLNTATDLILQSQNANIQASGSSLLLNDYVNVQASVDVRLTANNGNIELNTSDIDGRINYNGDEIATLIKTTPKAIELANTNLLNGEYTLDEYVDLDSTIISLTSDITMSEILSTGSNRYTCTNMLYTNTGTNNIIITFPIENTVLKQATDVLLTPGQHVEVSIKGSGTLRKITFAKLIIN